MSKSNKEIFKRGQLVQVYFGSSKTISHQGRILRDNRKLPVSIHSRRVLGVLVERETAIAVGGEGERWWKVYIPICGETYTIRTNDIKVFESSK